MPSPGTPPGPASLATLVDEFLKEIDFTRPHAAGNSLGGWVSLELAKRDRVRSATGISPAGFHNRPEAIFQRSSLWTTRRLAERLVSHVDRLSATALGRSFLGAQYFAHPSRVPPGDNADATRTLVKAAWFDETRRAINAKPFTGGEQINVPVTIAWGEHDRLLLPRQAPRAGRAIPRARVIKLTDCGHVPTWDDPEQVARVLLEGSSDG
jgi:pimeloyl-ACP methyl ester carboxylesterase